MCCIYKKVNNGALAALHSYSNKQLQMIVLGNKPH